MRSGCSVDRMIRGGARRERVRELHCATYADRASAELPAKLAKYEQIAREGLELAGDQEQRAGLQGEIAGLERTARLTRGWANWPVGADSELT